MPPMSLKCAVLLEPQPPACGSIIRGARLYASTIISQSRICYMGRKVLFAREGVYAIIAGRVIAPAFPAYTPSLA